MRTLLIAIVGLVVVPGMASPAWSQPLSGFGTATIDGVKSPGEWDAADTEVFGAGAYAGSTLLVMNDETNLYLALEVQGDADLTVNDSAEFRFDNDRDLVLTVNDDGADGGGVYFDLHYTGTVWVGDVVSHGESATGRAAAVNFIELAKPLDSGDTNDFALATSDEVGWCLRYWDNGSSGSGYPAHCILSSEEQSLYGVIKIAPPPPPIPTLSQWGLVAFGMLLLTAMAVALRRQRAA